MENISYIFGIIEKNKTEQNKNRSKNENKSNNSHYIHSYRDES